MNRLPLVLTGRGRQEGVDPERLACGCDCGMSCGAAVFCQEELLGAVWATLKMFSEGLRLVAELLNGCFSAFALRELARSGISRVTDQKCSPHMCLIVFQSA